ncbi:sulfite exporter TauE/SafE family protein [Devosia sp. 1566]|uniref:TSUP family transporter n=1 Tax=Devosia sp. 1566 TaxID=2499144 RepID=UPI000FD9650C
MAVLALIGAGAVQGSTGFGFNMLAAPILAVIDPVFVPGPMLVMAGLVCVGGMIREWKSVDFQGLGFSLGGRGLAAILAVFCLGFLDEATFSLIFGGMVLLAVALSLAGWKVTATPRNLFIAGSSSGFMGTLTSIGAPPMALVYQNAQGPVMRSTLNAFFVVGAAISLIALSLSGNMSLDDLWLALLLTPCALFGFLFSHWGRVLVDKGRVRMVVLVVSTASAIILIARQFV